MKDKNGVPCRWACVTMLLCATAALGAKHTLSELLGGKDPRTQTVAQVVAVLGDSYGFTVNPGRTSPNWAGFGRIERFTPQTAVDTGNTFTLTATCRAAPTLNTGRVTDSLIKAAINELRSLDKAHLLTLTPTVSPAPSPSEVGRIIDQFPPPKDTIVPLATFTYTYYVDSPLGGGGSGDKRRSQPVVVRESIIGKPESIAVAYLKRRLPGVQVVTRGALVMGRKSIGHVTITDPVPDSITDKQTQIILCVGRSAVWLLLVGGALVLAFIGVLVLMLSPHDGRERHASGMPKPRRGRRSTVETDQYQMPVEPAPDLRRADDKLRQCGSDIARLQKDLKDLRDNVATLETKLDKLVGQLPGGVRAVPSASESEPVVAQGQRRVEPQPQVQPRAVEDALMLYNAALTSGDVSALRSRFRVKSVAISASATQGVATATGAKTRFAEAATGNFLLVEEGGRILLFPQPAATKYDMPNFEECFDIERQQRSSKQGQLLLAVRQAAICQATSDGWALLQKGQLVIGS